MAEPAPSVLWFRRDLRLRDHAALMAAAEQGPVTALFVLDDELLHRSGAPRTAYLLRTLRALHADLESHGGGLVVRTGRPDEVVPALSREIGATAVHISADYAPYGARRDARVAQALGEVPLVPTGSPYAVAPGRVLKGDGTPYKVFTPFYRAWSEHGWRRPADSDPAHVSWLVVDGDGIPDDPAVDAELPPAGEVAAHEAWKLFCENGLRRYPKQRNRPDIDETSRMSPHLKLGTIHPRTILADLDLAHEAYRRQICWRDFYAQVLHHWPSSAHDYLKPAFKHMQYDTGDVAAQRFSAWQRGETGYPIVDAGMRQLLAEGWMHNRVRMVVASFLVKDLHLEWTQGRSTSWTTSSTATWPTTSTGGSGRPARAPTQRRTSASSTPSPRARSSTPTATTCAAGCRSCAAYRERRCTHRGRCLSRPTTTRPRSSTTPSSGARRSSD